MSALDNESVIHIARNNENYLLYPFTEKTLCGHIVSEVWNNGEFVFQAGSLSDEANVCPECAERVK